MSTRRKPLFIINPTAGGGRGQKLVLKIQEFCRARDPAAEVVCTERAGHAVLLAREFLIGKAR